MAKRQPPLPPLPGDRLYNIKWYNNGAFYIIVTVIMINIVVYFIPANAASVVAGAIGMDNSANPPTANANNLATFVVVNPGQYFIQNQCTTPIQVIYGNGINGVTSNGNPSIQILNAASSTGNAGGDTGVGMPWFAGQIQINGATNCPVMVRHD